MNVLISKLISKSHHKKHIDLWHETDYGPRLCMQHGVNIEPAKAYLSTSLAGQNNVIEPMSEATGLTTF